MIVDKKELAVLIRTEAAQGMRDLEKYKKNLRGVGRIGKYINGVFLKLGAALGLGFAAKGITRLSDQYKIVKDRVNLFASEQDNANDNLRELEEISNRTRTPLESNASLYGRLAMSQKALGINSAEVLRFTELINKSLKVSGVTTEQASGAIIQLGQAMGEGIVRSQEYNSLLENMPHLLQIAANNIEEAGGDVAKLRKIMLDGELTSKKFFNAIIKGGGEIDNAFGKVSLKFGDAITILINQLTRLIGKAEESYGIVGKITSLIVTASNKLSEFTNTRTENLVGELNSYKEEIRIINEEKKTASQSEKKILDETLKTYKEIIKEREKELIEIKKKIGLSKEELDLEISKLESKKSQKGSEIRNLKATIEKKKIKHQEGIGTDGDIDDHIAREINELNQKIKDLKKIETTIEKKEKDLAIVLDYDRYFSPSPVVNNNSPAKQPTIKKKAAPAARSPKVDALTEEELEKIKKEGLERVKNMQEKLEKELENLKETNVDGINNPSIKVLEKDLNKLQDYEKEMEEFLKKIKDRSEMAIGYTMKGANTIFQGIKVGLDNELLEIEKRHKKIIENLERETQAEKFFQELKQEQEREYFENKFGIEKEAFLNKSEFEQEQYISNLATRQDREELAEIRATESRIKNDKKIAEHEKKKEKQIKKIKSKQFELDKVSKIANIAMDLARGIISISTAPWITAIPGGGSIIAAAIATGLTALAAAQTANISKQVNPYAYKTGGIALTPQVATIAEKGPEMVLPAEITEYLMKRPNLHKIVDPAPDPTPPTIINNNYNIKIESNDPLSMANELKDKIDFILE